MSLIRRLSNVAYGKVKSIVPGGEAEPPDEAALRAELERLEREASSDAPRHSASASEPEPDPIDGDEQPVPVRTTTPKKPRPRRL